MSVHNTTCCRGIQAIWQCEEYIQHGTVKIKHVLHTPNIRISLHIRKNCELVWREDFKNLQRRGWAVPPIRSVFPDYGPFTDFFEEIGPDLVCIVWEKSDFCRYYCGSWIQLLFWVWFWTFLVRILVNAAVVGESSCSTSRKIGL